jgi:hypothetical protein
MIQSTAFPFTQQEASLVGGDERSLGLKRSAPNLAVHAPCA